MKKLLMFGLTSVLFFFNIYGNSADSTFSTLDDLSFGTDSTLEVMTWNLQNFPKNKETTIDYVTKVIYNLDVDIVGFQEIKCDSSFTLLIEKLNQIDSVNVWDGYRANSDKWEMNLAYLYKKVDDIAVGKIYEIYTDDQYAFPRHPLVMELLYKKTRILIINNHLKAKGGEKNEARRRDANKKLKKFVDENHPNSEVIILGDLNDNIAEPEKQNVFWNFIEDSKDYKFVDMKIASDTTSDWSYPYWPSHLDHILITNELFDEFKNPSSTIKTITIDKYLEGNWNAYYKNISDHRPVAIRLRFSE